MSLGISIETNPPVEGVSCYLQNLGRDLEGVCYNLVDDGFDIFPYVFNPEEAGRAEATGEHPADDPDIEEFQRDALRAMCTDDFHDPARLLKELDTALNLVGAMDEDFFNWGKDEFISDLRELQGHLLKIIAAKAKVQLMWC